MFKEYKNAKKELNELKKQYELLKLQVTQKKLELKYSIEYNQYKTIKEKEERANMEVKEMELLLIESKQKVREQELTCEILKLQIDYEYFN